MVKEIEIKGRVHNYKAVQDLLTERYRFIRNYHKQDFYYTLPSIQKDLKPVLRLRHDESWIVTKKSMELIDGMEINDEWEFEVSPGETFQVVIERLGFQVCCQNEKKGSEYQGEDIAFEFSEITGLGYFLEVEILLDDPDGSACSEAEQLIREAFLSFNTYSELVTIEPEYYTDMLLKKKKLINQL
jgi:adenylate cyclase, class 2